MSQSNLSSSFRTQILTAALAAAVFPASASLAIQPAVQVNDPAQIQDVLRLLDKDDDDVVIKIEQLPQAIRDYIAKDMPDAKITEARKDFKGNKEKKGDNFTYEVDVKSGKKEYEYRFSRDGKLLKKRENAGDEPAGK